MQMKDLSAGLCQQNCKSFCIGCKSNAQLIGRVIEILFNMQNTVQRIKYIASAGAKLGRSWSARDPTFL